MRIKKYLIILVIFLASFIASRELFKPGYFSMHDDLQIGRLYEMELCFKDKQIPCRWVPDMGYSYGYPLYNYYPPFPYYFGMVFRSLGFSFIDSVKILFILGFLFSAFFMFLLGKELWGDLGGLVSSIFYLFAPYHSVDVYVRGAMNEFWALAWFPLIFWSVLKIIKTDKNKYLSTLAVSYSLLLLSHNVMSLLFTPLVVAWGLLLIWTEKKQFKESFLKLAVGGLWGICLAAFFTLPAILEGKYVHTETMLMGYFNFLAHFVGLRKTLFTRFWGYGSSGWLQEAGMPFQVGFPQWPVAVLTFFLSLFLFSKKKIKLNSLIIFTFHFLLFTFSLFMVHPRSVFFWLRIPFLAYVQFPWRFLALTIFGMSVLAGGMTALIRKKNLEAITGAVLVILAIVLNFSFFRPEKIIKITDTEKLFSAKGWNKLQTDAIFDYLPKYAVLPPTKAAPEKPEVITGEAEFFGVKKGTNWYQFEVKVEKETKIEIPIYDFPGWKVWADGSQLGTTHDNFLGLITVEMPVGNYQVVARLIDTPIRLLSNLLSLLFWVVLLAFPFGFFSLTRKE